MNTTRKTSILLSACLIVRNAAEHLQQSLLSIQDVVDEIIVVDTGSEDHTLEIAKNFGCKVFSYRWNDSFADARNFSLEKATGKWILIIDADEVLQNAEDLRTTLQKADDSVGGFFISLTSLLPDRSQTHDAVVRIFRNLPQIRYTGTIHEQIIPSILSLKLHLQTSNVRILHYGYALSPVALQQKALRNLQLLNKQLHNNPADGYSWFQKGKTHLILGNFSEALNSFERALQHLPETHVSRVPTLNYLAWLAIQKQDYHTALDYLKESTTFNPAQTFGYFLLGHCYQQCGEFRKALNAFEKMLNNTQNPKSISHAMYSDYVPPLDEQYAAIASLYYHMGDRVQAEKFYRKGLAYHPESQKCKDGILQCTAFNAQSSDHSESPGKNDHFSETLDTLNNHTVAFSAQDENCDEKKAQKNITGIILSAGISPILPQTIASLSDLCDEIIIGNTGGAPFPIPPEFSTTVSIKILELQWENDFSKLRNKLLTLAQCSWIIIVDDDEVIPQETQEKIQEFLPGVAEDIGGIFVTIEHQAPGAAKSPRTQVLRIFRNNPQFHYEGVIHESITPSIVKSGYRIVSAPDLIFTHYTMPPSKQKIQLYRSLYEKAIAETQEKTKRAHYYFHYTLFLLTFAETADEIHRAEELIQSENFSILSHQQKATLLNALIRHKLNTPDYLVIKSLAEQSLSYYPEQCEALWYKILASLSIRDFPTALQSIELYLTRVDNYVSSLPFEKLPPYEQVKELVNTVLSMFRTQQSESADTEKFAPAVVNPQPLVSLCMIVKNEEKNLTGCLESVREFVDEIIIVDTGSEDRTVEIAAEYNARIFSHPWKNDFSAARNESIKHARGKWILYLDADERLLSPDAHALRTMLQELPDSVGGVLCIIESPHRLNNAEISLHRGHYPRIFRNLGYPKIHFRGKVHEQISPSIIDAGLSIVKSEILIHHSGYNCDPKQLRMKVERNYSLLFSHIQEHPTDAYAWFQLGQTLTWMHLPQEAEKALQFSLQLDPPLPDYLKAAAYASLAQLAGQKKRFRDAISYADLSLQYSPHQIYARQLKAYALLHLDQKEEARKLFSECLLMMQQRKRTEFSGFEIAVPKENILRGLQLCQQPQTHTHR